MLILTRRIGETIIIDEDITVTVIDVKKKQVSIGIAAPPNVSIHREEIFFKIQRQKEKEQNLKNDYVAGDGNE